MKWLKHFERVVGKSGRRIFEPTLWNEFVRMSKVLFIAVRGIMENCNSGLCGHISEELGFQV